ncbi:MAG: DUF3426 domain-containing protein [Polaromonas sp.]|nr:DUF3426 domain-containing protein [Polaromonas sp.]
MSLITRCPACGTMFKVVADQLKVSQGWVRCGHCTEVFDASAYLVPDDALVPAPSVLTSDGVAAAGHDAPLLAHGGGLQSGGSPDPVEASMAPASEHDASAADPFSLSAPIAAQDEAQARDDALNRASWKQARQDYPCLETPSENIDAPAADVSLRRADLVHTASVEATADESLSLVDASLADADQQPVDVTHDERLDEVSFVRDARRKVFWKKPLVRFSLAMTSLLLLLALALQWALHEKDTVAASQPQLAPLLHMLCAALHCEVRLPRHIASVVIDSSSFKKLGPDVYHLSFSLKNTGTIPLAMPSLEITLTDTRDRALVRRVLAPAQYGAGDGPLAAHFALAGAVTMKVASEDEPVRLPSPAASAPLTSLRVAGYRILAFYPD